MGTNFFEPFLVYSENMVGIDFNKMSQQSAILQLVRSTEELGFYNIEFERPPLSEEQITEWGFDDMQFRKGEW